MLIPIGCLLLLRQAQLDSLCSAHHARSSLYGHISVPQSSARSQTFSSTLFVGLHEILFLETLALRSSFSPHRVVEAGYIFSRSSANRRQYQARSHAYGQDQRTRTYYLLLVAPIQAQLLLPVYASLREQRNRVLQPRRFCVSCSIHTVPTSNHTTTQRLPTKHASLLEFSQT